MKSNHDEDIEGILLGGSKTKVPRKVLASLYEFYLSGNITEPEDYIEWFDIIRHCTQEDTVKIYINSGGGNLFTAIQFLRVLAETEATVVVSVEGICASAATLVFLSADVFEVTPHSMFLFHTYSGGTFGKGMDMYNQIAHERKWSEKLFAEVYEDFLTKEEINSMLENKDLWMDVDSIIERMNKRIAIREELEKLEEQTKPDGE